MRSSITGYSCEICLWYFIVIKIITIIYFNIHISNYFNFFFLCVLDFTIVYRHITRGLQFPPNLLQIHAHTVLSPPWSFHVHVKRYAIKDLPKDEEKLTEWVRQKFVEKDALLEDMKYNWIHSERLGDIRDERYF